MFTRVLSRPFFLRRGSQTDFVSRASTSSKDTAGTEKCAPSLSGTDSAKKENEVSCGKQAHATQAGSSQDQSCCDWTCDDDKNTPPFRYCHDPYKMVKDGVAQPALRADSTSAAKQDTSGSFVLVDVSNTAAQDEDDDSDQADDEFKTPFLGHTDIFASSDPPVADGNPPSCPPSPAQQTALAAVDKPTQTVMLSDIALAQDPNSSDVPAGDMQSLHDPGSSPSAAVSEPSSSSSESCTPQLGASLGTCVPTVASNACDVVERAIPIVEDAVEDTICDSGFSAPEPVVEHPLETNHASIVSRPQTLSPIPEEDSLHREQSAPVAFQHILQPSIMCDASSGLSALEQMEETVVDSPGAVDLARGSDCTTSDDVATSVASSYPADTTTASSYDPQTDEATHAIAATAADSDQSHFAEQVMPEDGEAINSSATQYLQPAESTEIRALTPAPICPSGSSSLPLPSAVDPKSRRLHETQDDAIKYPPCPIADFVVAMRDKPSVAHTPERPNWALAPEEPPPKPKSTRQSGHRGRGRGRGNGRPSGRNGGHRDSGGRKRLGSQAGGTTSNVVVANTTEPVLAASAPSATVVEQQQESMAALLGYAGNIPIAENLPPTTTVIHALDDCTGDTPLVTNDPSSLVPVPSGAPPIVEEQIGTQLEGSDASASLHTLTTQATSPTPVPASLALSPIAIIVEQTVEKPRKCDMKRNGIPTDGPNQWLKRVNSWMERPPSRGTCKESPAPLAPYEIPLAAPIPCKPANIQIGITHARAPSKGLNHNAPAWQPSYRNTVRAPSPPAEPHMTTAVRGTYSANEKIETTLSFHGIQVSDARAPVFPDEQPILAPISRRPGFGSNPEQVQDFIDRIATTEVERQHPTFRPFPENIMRPSMRTDYDTRGLSNSERADRWLGGAMSGSQDQRAGSSGVYSDVKAERQQSTWHPLPDPVFQLFPENTSQQTVSMRFEPQGGPRIGRVVREAPPPPPGARSFSLPRPVSFSGPSSFVASHQPPRTHEPYRDGRGAISRPSPAQGNLEYHASPLPDPGDVPSHASDAPCRRARQHTSQHSQAWRS
ncbi:hypothetical protein C8Q80DRAFT_543216 [Daedaleopsis nitida]|nr:hypothetical protein C8Q80DRAFT_543216 [Daedaleopsis nitida]